MSIPLGSISVSAVGEKIREARADLHMTQSEMARLLEVSEPAVRNWESGKAMPTRKNLLRLAALAKKTVSHFTGNRRDDMPELEDFPISDPSVPTGSGPARTASPWRGTPRAVTADLAAGYSAPAEEVPNERFLMEMLVKQQEQLSRQQDLLEAQRVDTSRLTECLVRQQEQIGKQQDLLVAERQFQQKLTLSQMEKLTQTVNELRNELDAIKAPKQQRASR